MISRFFTQVCLQLYLQKSTASDRDSATDKRTEFDLNNHLVCGSILGLFMKTNMEMQFLTKFNYQTSINFQIKPPGNFRVKCSPNTLLILKGSSFFSFLFPPDNSSLPPECGTKDSENTNNICSTRLYEPPPQRTNICLQE